VPLKIAAEGEEPRHCGMRSTVLLGGDPGVAKEVGPRDSWRGASAWGARSCFVEPTRIR
jgi:hypothetical protein